MASHRRGPWSQGEDAYLVQLVHTQGALNWVRIAQLIGSRSPKQCRERYHQNLKPTLNHEPISPEEGLQIERLVDEMGKRWAEIARRLHGRSDNAVKNWWNGSMNRRRRLVLRRRASSQCPGPFDEQPQPASFARPAESQPLNVPSVPYSSRHGRDTPLLSPSVSEASRAESIDGAPSLVSDNGSAFSISPRLAASPVIELPPLSLARPDDRRSSLPVFQMRPGTFVADGDSQAQAFSCQFQSNPKYAPSVHSPPPSYGRTDHQRSPASHQAREYAYDSRAQLPTAPPTPVQLPPLQLVGRSVRPEQVEQPGERDSRMHLSTLLG